MNSKSKAQYIAVLKEKQAEARLKRKKEEELFPQVWNLNLCEESVFSFIAHDMPMEKVLEKLVRKFIGPEKAVDLKLSWRYLFNTHKNFPGYFSDREKTVVIFNRFRTQDRDWSQLFYWVSFLSEEKDHPYTHLLLSVMFLDQYINHLHQEIWLEQSLKHLHMIETAFSLPESKRAIEALLAFGYYMQRDFNRSLLYISANKEEDFEHEFEGLIKKLA